MRGTPFLRRYLQAKLDDFYASVLWEDLDKIIGYYAAYDGEGQMWETATGLDYTPTKRITNHIKHLIKEEARFMFSRPPDITIVPTVDGEGKEANDKLCAELESHLRQVLERSGWQRKLAQAGRDCFVGKRVALKVCGHRDGSAHVQFKPSLEFFHDVEYDDEDRLTRIIFSHNRNNSTELDRQRIWIQTYYLEGGQCYLDEALYDGNGNQVEPEKARMHEPLHLPYIPVFVIINDGMLCDSLGESDVETLVQLQEAYNRLTSDDQDALKFNMFPQRVFTDASEASMEGVVIAPNAMVDLQTDPAGNGRQAQYGMLESGFNYDSRIENAIERVLTDMHKLLSVPKATTEDYKGMGVSGKALRALYWPLITRCEEKWATWDTALKWMVRCIIDVDESHGQKRFAGAKFIVSIDHLYPITDDEEAERELDMHEVNRKVRSIKSYLEKWQPNVNSDEQLLQIAKELRLLEDAYLGDLSSMNGRDSP